MDKSESVSLYIENGILIGRYNIDHVDIDIANYMLKKRLEATNGKPYPGLSDVRCVISFSKEAREYLASGRSYEDMLAGAILVRSLYQKLAGNFYLYFAKHPIPLKIFTDWDEAIVWLNQYVVK